MYHVLINCRVGIYAKPLVVLLSNLASQDSEELDLVY